MIQHLVEKLPVHSIHIWRLIADFITSFQCVCRGFQAPALDIYFIIRCILDNTELSYQWAIMPYHGGSGTVYNTMESFLYCQMWPPPAITTTKATSGWFVCNNMAMAKLPQFCNVQQSHNCKSWAAQGSQQQHYTLPQKSLCLTSQMMALELFQVSVLLQCLNWKIAAWPMPRPMPASLHCNYPITMLQWHTHSCQFQCHCLWNVDTVVAMLSIATDAALDKANVEVAANAVTAGWLFSFLHDWVCSNRAVQCCCCREAQCRHLSPLQQGAMQLPIASDTAKQVDSWFILFVVCRSMQKWHSWLFNWIVFKISFDAGPNKYVDLQCSTPQLFLFFYFLQYWMLGIWQWCCQLQPILFYF